MRHIFRIIVMAVALVAGLVLLAGNAYGQSDENAVDFWCDNGEKIEPVDTPFIVPDPPEGTTWTRLVLKSGTQNIQITDPIPGQAYSHPSGKEISHVILCYEVGTSSTTTSTTMSSSTSTTTPNSTTTTDPTTTTSSSTPTTEQRYLCEDGEVVAIGPDHERWEGASVPPGDPVCDIIIPLGVNAGEAPYSQFPAVEIAVTAAAWFLGSALAVAAYALIRKGDQ